MEKVSFDKPGNFLYPVPCVMVSCAAPGEKPNILTIAWTGTICSDPPMLSISVRKERFSYEIIRDSGEFVVNLTNKRLARAADFCGCRSGRDINKFEECHLTPAPCEHVNVPAILEAPVSIECKVSGIMPLGSHDMFLGEIVGVQVDRRYLDRHGAFHLENAGLIAYSHGKYYELGKILGTFGYSVRKKH
ncbi:MAG: flavin reductase family protein [Bilifractor sp.]